MASMAMAMLCVYCIYLNHKDAFLAKGITAIEGAGHLAEGACDRHHPIYIQKKVCHPKRCQSLSPGAQSVSRPLQTIQFPDSHAGARLHNLSLTDSE